MLARRAPFVEGSGPAATQSLPPASPASPASPSRSRGRARALPLHAHPRAAVGPHAARRADDRARRARDSGIAAGSGAPTGAALVARRARAASPSTHADAQTETPPSPAGARPGAARLPRAATARLCARHGPCAGLAPSALRVAPAEHGDVGCPVHPSPGLAAEVSPRQPAQRRGIRAPPGAAVAVRRAGVSPPSRTSSRRRCPPLHPREQQSEASVHGAPLTRQYGEHLLETEPSLGSQRPLQQSVRAVQFWIRGHGHEPGSRQTLPPHRAEQPSELAPHAAPFPEAHGGGGEEQAASSPVAASKTAPASAGGGVEASTPVVAADGAGGRMSARPHADARTRSLRVPRARAASSPSSEAPGDRRTSLDPDWRPVQRSTVFPFEPPPVAQERERPGADRPRELVGHLPAEGEPEVDRGGAADACEALGRGRSRRRDRGALDVRALSRPLGSRSKRRESSRAAAE